MWKYLAVAAIALTIGAVASPLIMRYLAGSILAESEGESIKAFSSEGRDWAEFSRFIEAGGRAYWTRGVVIDSLDKGMSEEDVRRAIGPPDAVLIGKAEISSSFQLGPQAVSSIPSDRRRPLDNIPYLERETAGIYIYKTGRIARDVSHIEQSIIRLEFSANGKF